MMSKEKLSIIFSILIFVVFSWAAVEAQQFRELARFFPFYIAIMGAIVVLADLAVQMRRRSKNKKPGKAIT